MGDELQIASSESMQAGRTWHVPWHARCCLPAVHLVNVERGAGPDGEEAPVESVANITQLHEALQVMVD